MENSVGRSLGLTRPVTCRLPIQSSNLAAKLLERGQLPCPILERARRRATHAGARLDVVLDVRRPGYLRAIADRHVADDARVRAHDDKIAQLRRAGNPTLRHNHAMAADDDVVRDLHEVVDFGAFGEASTRVVVSRRFDWIAASIGSTALRSSM